MTGLLSAGSPSTIRAQTPDHLLQESVMTSKPSGRSTPAARRPPGQQNSLRIIGGFWRGRKLRFPDVPGLRPTPDRVRETLFNWLQGLTLEEDCLDLYAGSGACGLEALSRGARQVVFVDASTLAVNAIRDHLKLLDCKQAEVVLGTAQQFMGRQQGETARRFGLVFMDPPFADGLLHTDCQLLENSGLLKADAYIYLESGDPLEELELPSTWCLYKQGRAGAVYYGLCRRQLPEQGEPVL